MAPLEGMARVDFRATAGADCGSSAKAAAATSMLGWQPACTQVLESSLRLAMLSPGRIGSRQIAHRPEYLACTCLPVRSRRLSAQLRDCLVGAAARSRLDGAADSHPSPPRRVFSRRRGSFGGAGTGSRVITTGSPGSFGERPILRRTRHGQSQEADQTRSHHQVVRRGRQRRPGLPQAFRLPRGLRGERLRGPRAAARGRRRPGGGRRAGLGCQEGQAGRAHEGGDPEVPEVREPAADRRRRRSDG